MRTAYEQFSNDQAHWLDDYALFRALKAKFNGAYYLEWPKELIQREPAALDQARRELADQVGLARFVQFLLYPPSRPAQGACALEGRKVDRRPALLRLARLERCVGQPGAVSPGFQQRRPRFVAGVPPDYFSATGQLWGNPVYNWDALRATGYRWWIGRLRALLAHVDVIRLDHFRGFIGAWHVPAGAPTAQTGQLAARSRR